MIAKYFKKELLVSLTRLLAAVLLGVTVSPVIASQTINHQFVVKLKPDTSHIAVDDTVRLTKTLATQPLIHFLLHDGLEVTAEAGGVSLPLLRHDQLTDQLRGIGQEFSVPVRQYTLHLPPGTDSFKLHYQGIINHPLKNIPDTLNQTPGLISKQGIFLSQGTLWYPLFAGNTSNTGQDDGLVTFSATVYLPQGWQVVSQGKRTLQKLDNGTQKQAITRWEEDKPQDDIYLVAGRYHQYQKSNANVDAMVFLREADEALAQNYLDATVEYINMYSKLIGPYPYAKFALVENFWETGFGMPSFTLLGPQVIRFPFIIHSSYPHEILHNWWGNSVYVDYDRGNWSEGLTAYLADHLIKEQQGQGAQYRRSALQKYTDYVSHSQDFPLSEFRSRHNAATEAVGYGKSLMLFHMLRERFGDAGFIKGLRQLYRQYQFKLTSFDDVQQVFSNAGGEDLRPWFAQWVLKSGAPDLHLGRVSVKPSSDQYFVRFNLDQRQQGEAYQLNIPVAIELADQKMAFQTTVTMNEKSQYFSVAVPKRPIRLAVDPEFDVFRRLDSGEIPAAMSQGFGAPRGLFVLPAAAPKALQKAYRTLVQTWQQRQVGKFQVKLDSEMYSLPKDRTVWLLGWNNRFVAKMMRALRANPVDIQAGKVVVAGQSFDKDKHTVVLAARNPANSRQTLLWLSTSNAGALTGLARKLPHYRKYSYLVFRGDAPTNVAKGQWDVTNSPMWHTLVSSGKSLPPLVLKPRKALAQLPTESASGTVQEH